MLEYTPHLTSGKSLVRSGQVLVTVTLELICGLCGERHSTRAKVCWWAGVSGLCRPCALCRPRFCAEGQHGLRCSKAKGGGARRGNQSRGPVRQRRIMWQGK